MHADMLPNANIHAAAPQSAVIDTGLLYTRPAGGTRVINAVLTVAAG